MSSAFRYASGHLRRLQCVFIVGLILINCSFFLFSEHISIGIDTGIEHIGASSKSVIDLILDSNSSSSFQLDSFFDCNHTKSICRYLRPGEFYQHYFSTAEFQLRNDGNISTHEFSSAHEYYHEWRTQIGLDNENLPALTSLSWWWNSVVHDSQINHQKLEYSIDRFFGFPHNVSYIHVHKCGGTSIQSALWRRAMLIRNIRFRIIFEEDQEEQQLIDVLSDVHTYKHSFGGGSLSNKIFRDEERLDFIRAISHGFNGADKYSYHKYGGEIDRSKQNKARTSYPIFTIIRDPIERFFSAVQQVMHYNLDFRNKCLHEPIFSPSSLSSPSNHKSNYTSTGCMKEQANELARQSTIKCAIQDMNETNFRRDVHLLPMASHFRLLDGTVDTDISISVFRMEDLDVVINHLIKANTSDINKSSYEASSIIHARDRSNTNYATSVTLAKLSIKDCNEEMLQQLCILYHVDVVLMKWLGFRENTVNKCKT